MNDAARAAAGIRTPRDLPPLAPRILEEAASWLLQMQDGPLPPARQAEFERWRARSAEHQRAWQRAERLLARIGLLPPALATRALNRPPRAGRRAALRALALLLAAAPLGWLSWRHPFWRDWLAADYVTAVGERLDITLEDGAEVALNTDTALDLRYDDSQRLLRLRRGEIYIRTAADTRAPPRPFLVQTDDGLLLALGTRYSVRQYPGYTELAVYEGAVQIHPDGADVAPGANIIGAGRRARYTRQRIEAIDAASEAALAWRKGLLIADDMPVDLWARELARYGRETIEVDAGASALRISGTFPIDDIPQALGMLAQTYRLRTRREGMRVRISR
ncbi:FecR family protein [Achromobacter sp. Marseille-Q0513]|uniref:FecR domain-containing protein n=1 Tax=Achromobacter sp. Marseille-Q0513 TaxID=2829161 RepID=UPI001B93BD06|nr:FecR family protein [Achromobacter sp. Marseille-Q0513]MBR8652962.1 FecR family protein [Achromobacter sp. Marseille-Q0513]